MCAQIQEGQANSSAPSIENRIEAFDEIAEQSDKLLRIKHFLDSMLLEEKGFPEELRKKIISARDQAWIEAQEIETTLNAAAF